MSIKAGSNKLTLSSGFSTSQVSVGDRIVVDSNVTFTIVSIDSSNIMTVSNHSSFSTMRLASWYMDYSEGCANTFDGKLCSSCISGYASISQYQCVKCPSQSILSYLVSVVTMVGIIAIGIFMIVANGQRSGKDGKEDDNSLNVVIKVSDLLLFRFLHQI